MAQCPTGYAPRLFWPGSHFYGFTGNGRNLWRPVYSRATSAGTFASWVAAASPLVTDAELSPSFSLPSFPLLSLLTPVRSLFLFSKVPPGVAQPCDQPPPPPPPRRPPPAFPCSLPAFSTVRAWYNGYTILCIAPGSTRSAPHELPEFKVEA